MRVCEGKCYYLKIIDLFREIIKLIKEKKRMKFENFKLLFRSKKIVENIYQKYISVKTKRVFMFVATQ